MAKFIRLQEMRREGHSECAYDVIVNLDDVSTFTEKCNSYGKYYVIYMKNGMKYFLAEESYNKLRQEVNA